MMPSGGNAGWILLLLAVVAAAIVFAKKNHARGALPAATAAGTVALVSGLITMGLAGAHLVVVLMVALGRSPLVYDFRLYSLVLLGVLLGGLALVLALAAPGVARGDSSLLRRTRNTALMLLAINVPLAPIQGFAILLCVLAAVTLIALFIAAQRGGADTAGVS